MSKTISKKTIFWVVLLVVLTIFSFKAILRPGYFPMHDDMQAMRVHQLDKCIKDGQIPCRWVPDMGYGYGYPQFNYYAPLPYYLMEIFHLGGFSILGAVKAGIVLGFILSALSMFALGRALYGNLGGFISGLMYTYAPYKATDVYNRGALGEFWAFVFLPLILWAILRIVRSKKHIYVVILAFSIAGLLLTHVLTSLMFVPVMLAWTLFLLWDKRGLESVSRLFAGAVWGVLLSAFFTIPVLLERKFVHIETLTLGFFNYLAHFISLRQIFTSTHWAYGSTELGPYDNFSFSLGIIHWLFALVSIVLAVLYRKKNRFMFRLAVFLALVSLGSLFFAHQKSSFIWSLIPPLSYLQFPWRFLAIATLSTSLLAGMFVYLVRDAKSKTVMVTVLVLLLFLFNLFTFRPRLWFDINDQDKFSGDLWEKQLTISIFDYLPIYAEAPPAQKAPEEPEILSGKAKIVTGEKGTDWQRWDISVESESTVRLSLYDFPGWRVYVDSQKVDINHDNDLGLITFTLQSGEHEIFAKLTNTYPRTFGNIATILALLAVPLIIIKTKRK